MVKKDGLKQGSLKWGIWTLIKSPGIFHFREGSNAYYSLTRIYYYWIMNERDLTLMELLLVSNEPINQVNDFTALKLEVGDAPGKILTK